MPSLKYALTMILGLFMAAAPARASVVFSATPNPVTGGAAVRFAAQIIGAFTSGNWLFYDTAGDSVSGTFSGATTLDIGSFSFANGTYIAYFSYSGKLGGGGSETNITNPASVVVTAVPEPGTWAMMTLGFLGLGLVAYRRRAGSARLIHPPSHNCEKLLKGGFSFFACARRSAF